MNNLFFIDYMLKNENILYISLSIIVIVGYFVFQKLKIKGLYLLALFVAAKIAVHTYIDDYIDNKKKLESIKHSHIIMVTILISLLVSLPAMIISKRIGIADH
jgi:hypothetical protein